MTQNGLTYLLWSDLTGITRTRGVPTRDLARQAEAGLGWAMAGQALTPFTDIVDNPWGPMDEARQIPDMATRFTIPGDHDTPEINAVICDSRAAVDEPWDCCVRSFCADALAAFEDRTELTVTAAFEHEFSLSGDDAEPETPFSFAAARRRHGFLTDLERMLTAAGVPVETVEPEYGLSQYEVSSGPLPALRAGDIALITREVIRETARRHGLHASMTPKPSPDAVGNGAHVHLSIADADGKNVTHDPAGPAQLSDIAQRCAAGILDNIDALVALTAPAPVSYARLGPHHWSCGFRAIGVQNREAALRVVLGAAADPKRRAKGANIEFRPVDAVASPYMVIGALVRAALHGIEGGVALPEPATMDPADMDEATRTAHGIAALPTTLDAALNALEASGPAKDWFSDRILSVYLAIKRWEAANAIADPDAAFAAYARTY